MAEQPQTSGGCLDWKVNMTTTVITPTTGALLAALADPEAAKETFATPEKAQAWVKEFDATNAREQKDVVNAAKEEFQTEFAAMIGDMVPRDAQGSAGLERMKAENYNPEAPGVANEGKFKNRTDFFRAVYDKQSDSELVAIRNAISTTGDGGFLVPESIRADYLTTSLEDSVVRSRATVIPMATGRVKVPVVDATSNVTTVFGGVQVYNTAEEGTINASQPKFGEIVLDAGKITAMCYVNREALQDSAISVAGLLDGMVPQAIAFKEDYDFLLGNGANQALGVLNAANGALVSVSKETGQAAGTIVYENIVKMFARLLPGSYSRSVWLVSPDAIPQLFTMGLVVGTGGSSVWNADAAAAPTMTLLGRPIIFTEKANTVGSKGDIALVDLSKYLIGDRQSLDAMASEHFAFSTDQVAYRFIERVDGRPGILSAITPKNGGAALSPFVTLNARA